MCSAIPRSRNHPVASRAAASHVSTRSRFSAIHWAAKSSGSVPVLRMVSVARDTSSTVSLTAVNRSLAAGLASRKSELAVSEQGPARRPADGARIEFRHDAGRLKGGVSRLVVTSGAGLTQGVGQRGQVSAEAVFLGADRRSPSKLSHWRDRPASAPLPGASPTPRQSLRREGRRSGAAPRLGAGGR